MSLLTAGELVPPDSFMILSHYKELTLTDLYDTAGKGGATCSGPTQIMDVQGMSRVVTGKIDHGALGCGRDHEQLTRIA
ncbi:hypothetical protein C0J52_03883 [Blattella germanica]|nr:hypothetical protein C0J52_03883 [Blattella germanica]